MTLMMMILVENTNLPWGADLKDPQLLKALLKIFTNLDEEKLSKLDSSNPNESFNNTLRSKAPKDKHYSGGNSLPYRLSAAVCQKNEGYSYVSKVHEKLHLSPGVSAVKEPGFWMVMSGGKRKNLRPANTKLRRLFLKSERNADMRSCEVREGDTYETCILDGGKQPDLEEITAPCTDQNIPDEVDINNNEETIQDDEIVSSLQNEHDAEEGRADVFFDLETTGLGRGSSITQISARCKEKSDPIHPDLPGSFGNH